METIKIRGYNVTIKRDDVPDSPDVYVEPDRIFIYADSRHLSIKATKEHMERRGDLENYDELPLYAYVHGGVSISDKPFSCKWDSGRIGSIYVWSELKEDRACKIRAWITMWNQYLSGDVWWVTVRNQQGEVIESCGSIYGYDEAVRIAYQDTPDEIDETMSETEARRRIAEAVKKCFDRIPKELVEELTEPLKYAGV